MNRKKLFIGLGFLLCFGAGSLFGVYVLCCKVNTGHLSPRTLAINPFKNCYTCDSTLCTIPYKDIETMLMKYRDERAIPTNTARGSGFEDSKSIVFNVNSLKQYICKVERLMMQNKFDHQYNLAGLRFYFTVYPAEDANESPYMDGIPADSRERHSLIIMPAYLSGSNYIDFDPQYYSQVTNSDGVIIGTPKSFDALSKYDPIFSFSPDMICNGVSAMNHGGMCPPNCIGTLFGPMGLD